MARESPFYCKSCTTERLVTAHFQWYEYLLPLLFLRPYRCRHCFRRYIRPIVL